MKANYILYNDDVQLIIRNKQLSCYLWSIVIQIGETLKPGIRNSRITEYVNFNFKHFDN